jgi:hypothetical protein
MDYTRQLRNDEKRQTSAIVATIQARDLSGVDGAKLAISTMPRDSVRGKVYAVITEAFPAGSTLDWGLALSPNSLFTDLDLTSVGATRASTTTGAVFVKEELTYIQPNQATLDATVGEVKLVIEIAEMTCTTGEYAI